MNCLLCNRNKRDDYVPLLGFTHSQANIPFVCECCLYHQGIQLIGMFIDVYIHDVWKTCKIINFNSINHQYLVMYSSLSPFILGICTPRSTISIYWQRVTASAHGPISILISSRKSDQPSYPLINRTCKEVEERSTSKVFIIARYDWVVFSK